MQTHDQIGQQGRIYFRFCQDIFVTQQSVGSPEIEAGKTSLLLCYEGIEDGKGVRGWFTRFFRLADQREQAIQHLHRMICPDNFRLTDDEVKGLIRVLSWLEEPTYGVRDAAQEPPA